MKSLCPDEIVASVVRWSNDHVMCGQSFERVFENKTRQVWAVAVEGNGASLMTLCEVRKHRSEACSRPSPFCATTRASLPANCANSFKSESGHMMATSTSPNDRASASVSSKRQQ